jgi:uncharacterized membrane protein YsdA (DUF1294 family)/cold shock CspA family protein
MATDGSPRIKGTLTVWNDARGFGFLFPSTGGPTIWVHIKAFRQLEGRPQVGERFTFEVDQYLDGTQRAQNVTPIRAPKLLRNPKPWRKFWGIGWDSLSLLAIPAFAVLFAFVALFWEMPLWVSFIYIGLSIVCYVAYSVDKTAAALQRWRISENALLGLGVIGGWPGAIIAQQVLRHKTKKRGFVTSFWRTVVLNVVLFVTIGYYLFQSEIH